MFSYNRRRGFYPQSIPKPRKTEEFMDILASSNVAYLPYLAVMLTSVRINNPESEITAWLLESSVTDKDLDFLKKCLEGQHITVNRLHVELDDALTEKLPHTRLWSLETYYRLMMTELVPDTVDRILYLDVDMVVNGSLKELWETDLEGTDMAVCADCNGLTTADSMTEIQRKMLKEALADSDYHYFNAGMLLINLERLREHYSFETYLSAMKDWDYQMTAPDQDILNYVHWRHLKYVDWRKYDCFTVRAYEQGMTVDDLRKNATIIHFAGEKPWNNVSVHYPTEEVWWDYAEKTPMYLDFLKSFVHSAMTSYESVVNSVMAATGAAGTIRELQEQVKKDHDLLLQASALIKKLSS